MARIYRNELKYEVEPKDVLRLESRLAKVLGCDQGIQHFKPMKHFGGE